MNKIKAQADKLWQLLSQPATGAVYQQVLAVTWAIIKEVGLLLWLTLCLVLVVGDWGWKYSYELGQKARTWITDLQTKPKASEAIASQEPVSPEEFWKKTGQSLLAAGQKSVATVLDTAKSQLDLDLPVVAIAEPVAKPAPTAPAPVAPVVPAPSVSPSPEPAIPEPIATSDTPVAPAEVSAPEDPEPES